MEATCHAPARNQRPVSDWRLDSAPVAPIDLYDLQERSSDGWDRVVRAFGFDEDQAVDELCAIEKQLNAALPSDELRTLLLRYSESFNCQVSVVEDAAFAVGIEIGRRMAGGAR